ncbi:hypothetical protein [Tropicibacter sp. R16_0]|uniref:hypothetical protein n=1 Tax=Tropicibacter sp. R16_0 TaxID=2821102 RepID=UPI002570BF49|nr:hypothetical protein [Tropicibacter sp. R16_0]
MLSRLDDSSLDSTRRTSIVFTAISLIIFTYTPSLDLESIGFLDFSKSGYTEVPTSAFAIVLFFALCYLMVRTIVWIPIHRNERNKSFESLNEYTKKYASKIEEIFEPVFEENDTFKRNLSRINLEENRDLLAKLHSAMQGYNLLIKEFKDCVEVGRDILHEIGKTGAGLFPGNSAGLPSAESEKILRKLYEYNTQFPGIDLGVHHEAIKELSTKSLSSHEGLKEADVPLTFQKIQGLENSIKNYANTLEYQETLLPERFAHDEEQASKFSNLEMKIFAEWTPILVVSIGLTLNIQLILNKTDLHITLVTFTIVSTLALLVLKYTDTPYEKSLRKSQLRRKLVSIAKKMESPQEALDTIDRYKTEAERRSERGNST